MTAVGQERSEANGSYQVRCVFADLLTKALMHTKSVLRFWCYVLAALLLLFSGWCLLWVLSSSSMAFTECSGAYDLLSANVRCRQPAIAGLLALVSLLCAAIAVFVGWRLGRRP